MIVQLLCSSRSLGGSEKMLHGNKLGIRRVNCIIKGSDYLKTRISLNQEEQGFVNINQIINYLGIVDDIK